MADPNAGYPPPTEQAAYPPLDQAVYPPPPEQVGYPPQPGYPPQETYPPQPGYPPQEAYFQQQPPPQPYPPQAYPPQPMTVEQPPPYYQQPPPAQTQTDKTNVVVVQSQPQVVTTTTYYRPTTSDFGTGAMVFAIFSSFCVCFFGLWCSLICTIPAIFFALNSNTAAAAGNLAEAQSQRNLSFGCSSGGLVSTAVFWVIIIIAIAAG